MRKAIFILALALTLTVLSIVQVSAACNHDYEIVDEELTNTIKYSECITYYEYDYTRRCTRCGYEYTAYGGTDTVIVHTWKEAPDGKVYCKYCWAPYY